MDPNQTWKELADAMEEGDAETAIERAASLFRWLDNGGFAPTITRHQDFDRIAAMATCLTIMQVAAR